MRGKKKEEGRKKKDRIRGDWRRKKRVSRGSRCKRGGKVDADKYARHGRILFEGSVRAFLFHGCARSRAINPRDG